MCTTTTVQVVKITTTIPIHFATRPQKALTTTTANKRNSRHHRPLTNFRKRQSSKLFPTCTNSLIEFSNSYIRPFHTTLLLSVLSSVLIYPVGHYGHYGIVSAGLLLMIGASTQRLRVRPWKPQDLILKKKAIPSGAIVMTPTASPFHRTTTTMMSSAPQVQVPHQAPPPVTKITMPETISRG